VHYTNQRNADSFVVINMEKHPFVISLSTEESPLDNVHYVVYTIYYKYLTCFSTLSC
jgi:hypothetical protein